MKIELDAEQIDEITKAELKRLIESDLSLMFSFDKKENKREVNKLKKAAKRVLEFYQ